MNPLREKEGDVGTRGSGVPSVVEIGTGNKGGDEHEDENQKMKRAKKIEMKELRHLQVLRRYWIGSEEQSCDSQCRMGT